MSVDIGETPSWTNQESARKQISPVNQLSSTPTQLSTLVNSYTINLGPPKTITVPNASKLATLQEVSVDGTLLPKQFIRLDPKTNKRTIAVDPTGYTVSASDGDLHLDLGTRGLQPHITCELQNATAYLSQFKKSVGLPITIDGFFRCLFEHPGFLSNDDAHIFEIHPVRAVVLSGKTQTFDVGIPDQKSIHTWTSPHLLNNQDNRIKVSYNSTSDALTFTGMDGQDENYVRVPGTISQVQRDSSRGTAASFVLTSPDIG
ncbi:MAG TPA: hypothetical protein VNA15_02185, partial [Candidatus Angelobacter sp.]|nr:hypothetical protein [Candidatus Angelobacter sp.]